MCTMLDTIYLDFIVHIGQTEKLYLNGVNYVENYPRVAN